VEEMKRCNTCGEELPSTREYFNKSSDNRDGLRGECKQCRKNYNKLYRTPEYKEEMVKKETELITSETKKCVGCGNEFPRTSEYFHVRTDTRYGFRNKCKACIANDRRIYVMENKEVVAANRKQYRLDNIEAFTEKDRKYRTLHHDAVVKRKKKYYIEHYDVVISYQKKYNIENADIVTKNRQIYYQNNKEKSLERNKHWRIKNPEKMVINGQRRRARVEKLPNTFTALQWKEAKEYFNYKCAYCGEEAPLAMDHVVPVSKGGEFTRDNIVPSCQSCNSKKKTKECVEWFRTQPTYTLEKEIKILSYLGYENNKQQLSLF